MDVSVGTFNLNNLFSRFNFEGAVEAIARAGGAAGAMTVRYEFTAPTSFRVRTFQGKLVTATPRAETEAIAARIRTMSVDVLAVQEVEDLDILKAFNREHRGGLYRHVGLVEGNDPRFIDVGVLSRGFPSAPSPPTRRPSTRRSRGSGSSAATCSRSRSCTLAAASGSSRSTPPT